MKKTVSGALAMLLCLGLWGCGQQAQFVEEMAAPTEPIQSQPATESTEPTESVEPTEYVETYTDENGNTVVLYIDPNGSRSQTYNYPDGSMVSIYDDPATGDHSEMEFSADYKLKRSVSYQPGIDRHSETEYYENGNMKRTKVWEPDFLSEQEYYENGNLKWFKSRSPEESFDAQYNEEGYCTYYYASYDLANGTPYELECFGDETGKLVKVMENGEESDVEQFLTYQGHLYNFRR